MKKQRKILALAVSVSVSASILVGCSNGIVSIYNAVKKTSTITSAEVQTDVTLKLSAKNMSAEEKKDIGNIMSLNDSQIHVLSKFNQSADKTTLKSQADINAKVGKNNYQTSIWTNVNNTTSKTSTTEIVKVPKFISDRILQLKGKDYVVVSSAADVQSSQIDYKKIADLEPKLTAFLNEYVKNYTTTVSAIKSLGNKTINQNGKKQDVEVYQMALTDSTLKKLLHDTVNNLPNNKSSLALLKDYVTSVVSAVAPSKEEATSANTQIENAFSSIDSYLPQAVKQLDSTISLFDKVKVLGDKGIVIQFAINKDGYIVNEQGDIQVVIDTPNITKALGNTSATAKGVYTVDLHFSNDIRNINGNVAIVAPKTTTNNSVTMDASKLADLFSIYTAHNTVDLAVKSNNVDVINDAKQSIINLPEGKDKTSMLSQLSNASKKIDSALTNTKSLVKKAKSSLVLSDYQSAYNAINQLPTSMRKPLLSDLTSVSKKVYTSDVNNALKAIDAAKKKYTNANVKAAQTAISKVKNKVNAKQLQQLLNNAKPKGKK